MPDIPEPAPPEPIRTTEAPAPDVRTFVAPEDPNLLTRGYVAPPPARPGPVQMVETASPDRIGLGYVTAPPAPVAQIASSDDQDRGYIVPRPPGEGIGKGYIAPPPEPAQTPPASPPPAQPDPPPAAPRPSAPEPSTPPPAPTEGG